MGAVNRVAGSAWREQVVGKIPTKQSGDERGIGIFHIGHLLPFSIVDPVRYIISGSPHKEIGIYAGWCVSIRRDGLRREYFHLITFWFTGHFVTDGILVAFEIDERIALGCSVPHC